MIYPTNKIRNRLLRRSSFGCEGRAKSEIRNQKQQGVTLLLAILVLSAILAISFSIATILFTEVRTSGDLLRTETALYGAGAVAEEALFKIKRKVPSFTYTTKLGGVDLGSPAPIESSTTTPIYQDKVATTDYTFANTTKHYVLFDPDNPTGPSKYGKIKLTYINSGYDDPLTVYLCEFDPLGSYEGGPCTDTYSSEYWLTPQGTGFPLTKTNSPKEWFLNENKQQELILVNTNHTNPIYVQIETFGPPTSYAPKGMPLVGEIFVDVTAKKSGVTRKIELLIPKN
jgi:hypothetical protein